jgi:hypothetical protein
VYLWQSAALPRVCCLDVIGTRVRIDRFNV